MDNKTLSYYHEAPGFTAQEFSNKLKRLLTEDSFKKNAIKMKVASLSAGGCKLAGDVIERAYVHFSNGQRVERIDG